MTTDLLVGVVLIALAYLFLVGSVVHAWLDTRRRTDGDPGREPTGEEEPDDGP